MSSSQDTLLDDNDYEDLERFGFARTDIEKDLASIAQTSEETIRHDVEAFVQMNDLCRFSQVEW